MRRRLQGEAGFTIMELLVVMGVLIVVMGAIYTLWFGLQRSYSFTNDDLTAQYQARQAMAEMVEFVRTARQPENPPTEELNLVIYSAEANSLVVWTDADRDAAHDLELCRFRIDPATKTLFRDTSQTGDQSFSSGTAVRMITGCVTNDEAHPLFTYVGADGQLMTPPLGDPSFIREIHVHLMIDVYDQNRPVAHELTSTIQPRNLR